MWPLIYKKKSVVAVGGMSSGKSVGYLVPLVRMISSYPDYPRPVNQSPLAVVLCPSWRDVVAVEGWFKDLSKGLTVPGEKDNRVETGKTAAAPRQLKVLAIYEKESEEKKIVALANGAHVLITTPPSLKRMLTADNPVTNVDRCCHLVVEKADETFERFEDDVNFLMEVLKVVEAKRQGHPIQAVLTSRHWDKSIRQFAQKFLQRTDRPGPSFLFVDFIEAFVYGRQQMRIEFMECPDEKMDRCMALLKSAGGCKGRKKVVLCSDEAAARSVEQAVRQWMPGTQVFMLAERVVGESGSGVKESSEMVEGWAQQVAKGVDAIFILSDLYFLGTSLSLQPGDLCVHFDLQSHSLTKQKARFMHSKEGLVSFYENEAPCTRSNVYLLITVDDERKLKHIYGRLLTRASVEIPDKLRSFYLGSQTREAEAKRGSPICDNVVAFGRCRQKVTCPLRHFLVGGDTQGPLADKTDMIKVVEFNIVEMTSASSFFVKLARVRSADGKVGYRKLFE